MTLVKRVRRWAHGSTRRRRYSPVGMIFHWGMAALVTFQLWWGWHIGRLPVGPDKLQGYQVHSQLGLAILILILLRGLWRMAIPGPVNDADKPGWQSAAAHVTHFAFYGILILLPLTGWAMWSAMAADQPLGLAGAPWPLLPFGDLSQHVRWRILDVSRTLHFALVMSLLGLICVHVGAALKHHFMDRDDVLAGMTPFLEPLPSRSDSLHRRTPLRSPPGSGVDQTPA